MTKQKRGQTSQPFTVDEKYRRLALYSLRRDAQVSGRFRALRLVLDDLFRRPAISAADRERTNALLLTILKSVEVYENQAEDSVRLSTVVCLDATTHDVPHRKVAQSLRLMGDPRLPLKRPGSTNFVRCRGVKAPVGDDTAVRPTRRVRHSRRASKSADAE